MGWVVYDNEMYSRKLGWVEMPKDYLGTPLYEHATDYITELETGERVMVRKSDGFIFPNSNVLPTRRVRGYSASKQ